MATSCPLTIDLDLRAVRRAALQPARRASRRLSVPVAGQPASLLHEVQA